MSSINDTTFETGSSPSSMDTSLTLHETDCHAGMFARKDGKKQTQYPKSPVPLARAGLPKTPDFRSANRWSVFDDEAEEGDEDDTLQVDGDSELSATKRIVKVKERRRRRKKNKSVSCAADTKFTALTIVPKTIASEQFTYNHAASKKHTSRVTRIELSPEDFLARIVAEEGRQRVSQLEAQQETWRADIAESYYALGLSVQKLAERGIHLDGTPVPNELIGLRDIRNLLDTAYARASTYETITEQAYQWSEPQGINHEMWEYRGCGSFVPVSEEESEMSVSMPDGTVVQGKTEPDENCR